MTPRPRTLRCLRFLAMILVAGALFAAMGALTVQRVRAGEVRGEAVAVGAVLIVLALAMLPALRSRMILDDAGLTLVSAYRRHRFDWTEITEITSDSDIGFWRLQVRSADREHLAAWFPVPRSTGVDSGTRLDEPSADTPYGLFKLHSELWEEWRRHTPENA